MVIDGIVESALEHLSCIEQGDFAYLDITERNQDRRELVQLILDCNVEHANIPIIKLHDDIKSYGCLLNNYVLDTNELISLGFTLKH